MKLYLPLFLLLATACGSKKEDPAIKAAPNPDAVPAGQHLIKVVYTGSGWSSYLPNLFIFQSTQNTAGKLVYQPVSGNWNESVDAANTRILRLAYRDTSFALRFCAGGRTRNFGAPAAPAGATLSYKIYVDGREQLYRALVTADYGDQELCIDTKNLK